MIIRKHSVKLSAVILPENRLKRNRTVSNSENAINSASDTETNVVTNAASSTIGSRKHSVKLRAVILPDNIHKRKRSSSSKAGSARTTSDNINDSTMTKACSVDAHDTRVETATSDAKIAVSAATFAAFADDPIIADRIRFLTEIHQLPSLANCTSTSTRQPSEQCSNNSNSPYGSQYVAAPSVSTILSTDSNTDNTYTSHYTSNTPDTVYTEDTDPLELSTATFIETVIPSSLSNHPAITENLKSPDRGSENSPTSRCPCFGFKVIISTSSSSLLPFLADCIERFKHYDIGSSSSKQPPPEGTLGLYTKSVKKATEDCTEDASNCAAFVCSSRSLQPHQFLIISCDCDGVRRTKARMCCERCLAVRRSLYLKLGPIAFKTAAVAAEAEAAAKVAAASAATATAAEKEEIVERTVDKQTLQKSRNYFQKRAEELERERSELQHTISILNKALVKS